MEGPRAEQAVSRQSVVRPIFLTPFVLLNVTAIPRKTERLPPTCKDTLTHPEARWLLTSAVRAEMARTLETFVLTML